MNNIWIFLCFTFGVFVIFNFFQKTSKSLAFREFFIMLYSINYIVSPAIIYVLPQDLVIYKMKITPDHYFPLAFIGMFGLILGTYTLNNIKLFKPNIKLIEIEAKVNVEVLKQWTVFGILVNLSSSYFPGEIAFFLYLLSLIRYVGAFGLFTMDSKRNWVYIVGLLCYEFLNSLRFGLFHDFVMWTIFFMVYFIYIRKIGNRNKLILLGLGIVFVSIIQNSKGAYRGTVSSGGGGISDFVSSARISNENSKNDYLLSSDFINSITRINQAWIFASTVKNMDDYQNFQGLANVKLYFESAILPRILAKNKLGSGNKEIFNKFAGHTISENTSMGLGIFADGYIAYGVWGVFIFCYSLGFLFSFTFQIILKWTRMSPFFFIFMFPILNYAVRPDCEVQTILGHIVKSLMVYSIVVWYYKSNFKRNYAILRRLKEEGKISF